MKTNLRKSTLILRRLAVKALKGSRFKMAPYSIIQHSTPQKFSMNRNNDSCIIVHTTKKIRCVFNSGPHSTLKSYTWEKTQTTNSYRPQFHVNRFDPKRDLHEFTCNILPFIQFASNAIFMEFTIENSFHIYKYQHTYVPHESHNCEFFLFLTDTTRQATIHIQPRSSNIFVQHDKDIMTQHGICKDTDTIKYIKPRMRNTSQHEPNTRHARQIIPAN